MHKASLIAEARDGLYDAVEAYQARGLDDATAQHLAVADFGTVNDVLPAYQAELAVAQGRRLAILLTVGCPVSQAVSGLAWRHLTPSGAWQPGPAYALLADTVDVGNYAIAVAAVLALLGLGIGNRFVAGVRVARAVALGRWWRSRRSC